MGHPRLASIAVRAIGMSSSRPVDLIAVGRISGPWGVRGHVRVQSYSAPDESVLLSIRDWWLVPAVAGADALALRVANSRVHGGDIVVQFSGIDDRNLVEPWRGFEVHVRHADFPACETDEFYWRDLIGCTVVNRGGEVIGQVRDLQDHGAQPILEVAPAPPPGDEPGPRAADAGPVLIPFVAHYVDAVDLPGRVIRVDWLPDYG